MKRILVGLDGSARAPAVLAQAVALGEQLDARLTVIRAVGIPVDIPATMLTVSPDALAPNLLVGAQSALTRVTETAPAGMIALAESRLGTPWQVLCDAAKEFNSELIVIGTHGYGMLDRLLGTTAARVVNHAPCSVLVVRGTTHS